MVIGTPLTRTAPAPSRGLGTSDHVYTRDGRGDARMCAVGGANGEGVVDQTVLDNRRKGGYWSRPTLSLTHSLARSLTRSLARSLVRSSGTADGYRAAALATGRTSAASLYPLDDRLLHVYVNSPHLKPFEKHLPNARSPYEPLEDGGFVTGKEAVTQRGIDLRLFFDESARKVVGLVRFDERNASIGAGYGLSVHGGAIQTALDEATAEAGKMLAFPYLATRRISHEIRKPVPSERTLAVKTAVTGIKGLRCFVSGEICDVDDDTGAEVVLASAEAELVNMVYFL